jgi:hypothetical protein
MILAKFFRIFPKRSEHGSRKPSQVDTPFKSSDGEVAPSSVSESIAQDAACHGTHEFRSRIEDAAISRFSRIFLIFSVICFSGCAVLQSREALRACAVGDVLTTVSGVRAGLIREANPLWRTSMNAGNFAPFVLATVMMVWAVEYWASPEVSGVVAGVECGLAARNLFLMR